MKTIVIRRNISVLLCLLAAFSLFFEVEVLAAVDKSVKVYDYAELLSDNEQIKISELANEVLSRQKMDVAIVTTNDVDGKTSEEYADDFFDYNGFGYGSSKSGLLFLLNMQGREIYISTSGEAIQLFYDKDIDVLLDECLSNMAEQDYYGACLTFLSGADMHITKARTGETANAESLPLRERYSMLQIVLISLAIGFSLSAVVVLIMLFYHKKSFSSVPGASVYVEDDSFKLNRKVDAFLHTHTTKVPIPKNTNSGGGTSHKSSSGSFHGGGGKKF